MKIAVLGSTGQLGSDLVEVLNDVGSHRVFPLGHEQLDVTSIDSVRSALAAAKPDVVVNCAAFHQVDACEDQPEEAFLVNAVGALNVARVCSDLDALCVYISTDYVFDGEKDGPYTEDDTPRPVNVYGVSKLAGESLVSQGCPRWMIARVASLFGKEGARGKGGNFVEAILARARDGQPLRVISDTLMSPTYTRDAAVCLESLLVQGATGLVHLTNDGACSWHEFASKGVELAGLDAPVEAISSAEYATKAHRPSNSSLKSTRLDGLSSKEAMRPWPKALEAYLVEKGHRPVKA